MLPASSDLTLALPLVSYFKAVVDVTPNKIAFVAGDGQTFSYLYLYQRAAFIAESLPAGDAPVALALPYDIDLLAAILACLAIGRPYLPLDPDFPPERNAAIIQHAKSPLILTRDGAAFVNYADATACLVIPAGISQQPLNITASADSLAYILYTSGTTGTPKGVFQNQRGLLHDILQYSEAIAITADDCFSGVYSASVNGALRDIFAALLHGATLVRINPKTAGMAAIAKSIAQYHITVLHLIPPLLRSFLQSKPESSVLRSIRCCYIAGDRLFTSDLVQLFAVLPEKALIYNGIGSTECATLYRHWIIDRTTTITSNIVPVGYAIADRITVLHPLPDGTAEVEVQSPYLALGYWQAPELSATSFKAVPGKPGWRSYRTGDLVRVANHDLYSFVARADNKQKIRGYLVDLSLLEAELRSFAEIMDAAVLTRQQEDRTQLIAVLVGNAAMENKLKAHLTTHFSQAVVPHVFIWLAELPRLANFKLDQTALQLLVNEQISEVAPVNTPLPDYLAWKTDKHYFLPVLKLWQQILKQAPFSGFNGRFCDLGGDSLDGLNFIAQLDLMLSKPFPLEHFSVQLSLADIIAVLIAHGCEMQAHRDAETTLVVVPPFVGFGWAKDFAEHIASHIRLIMVPTYMLYNPIGDSQPELAVVVDKLCQFIKSHYHQGVLHFYGVSSGAKPTFFAACRLQAEGLNTGTVIIGDCAPVGRAEHFASERLQAYSWLNHDLPFYHGSLVEVIAAQQQDGSFKTQLSYGWQHYCKAISYLPVLANHVAALTAPPVVKMIKSVVISKQNEGIPCTEQSPITTKNLRQLAHQALLAGNNLLAICYYEHLFAGSEYFRSRYSFNLALAWLRLQPEKLIHKASLVNKEKE